MTHSKNRAWLKYWGKAIQKNGGESDHPLVFHALDVAACARVYLERQPLLLEQLAQWLGLPNDVAKSVLTFLLAVHDIGKFAENFQNKALDVVLSRFGHPLGAANSTMRHDEVSAYFLGWMLEKDLLPENWRGWTRNVWRILLTASFGHHGVPRSADISGATQKLRSAMFEQSRENAKGFFDWCADTFLPDVLPACDETQTKLASWWIAGLAVLADWLGSNTNWFEYADEEKRQWPLEEYWQWALSRANTAIDESGVTSHPFKPYVAPDVLLTHLRGVDLRPAQALAARVPIPTEPQIFFLEDATGSGKTEASLILAARLIDAGLADGLYFGLPTQATADQMFERVNLNLPAWFVDARRATTVLAHGARDLTPAFKALLHKHDTEDDTVNGEPDTASLCVTEWLAQSNKRALLAQVGVGTLDQTLMAALRVRHQSLRMLGLFRKVLLVDEVHSYDDYMTQVLCETLQQHAAAGGSAILLSATMSLALRSKLLGAYAKGIDLRNPKPRIGRRASSSTMPAAQSLEYPLLTRWHSNSSARPDEFGFEASLHSQRTLEIEYLNHRNDVLARIELWMVRRQSIVWVRNTVGDANQAYTELAARYGADRVVLFHSRFAAVDRRRIQNGVLKMLGKHSDASMRTGKIVIATQVLQESLDVDADQMICDLSFIDVILQRLGRYRRHRRDAQGNPLPASKQDNDGREPGPVVIYGPDRDGEPDAAWYSRFSRGAARVYRAYGKLYRSAKALGNRIELPRQFRTLIEAVYDENSTIAIPDVLQAAEDKDWGEKAAQRGKATNDVIKLPNGYEGTGWSDDERIGTRLGDSIEATLVRVEGDQLVAWAQGRGEPDEDEWALSAIRLPGWWLGDANRDMAGEAIAADPALAAQVEQIRARYRALKHRLILPLVVAGQNTWHCTLAGSPPTGFSYCDSLGLRQR